MTVSNLTVASNLGGMAVSRGTLINVTAIDNVLAMDVPNLRAENLTVTGCHGEYCIETNRAWIDGLTATGNTVSEAVFLVEGGRIRLRNVSLTGNTAPVGILSVSRGSTRLEDSVVEGHSTDLFTYFKPRLTNTTCGSSARYDPPPHSPWGVCTND